jgi:hypothetical protein
METNLPEFHLRLGLATNVWACGSSAEKEIDPS